MKFNIFSFQVSGAITLKLEKQKQNKTSVDTGQVRKLRDSHVARLTPRHNLWCSTFLGFTTVEISKSYKNQIS